MALITTLGLTFAPFAAPWLPPASLPGLPPSWTAASLEGHGDGTCHKVFDPSLVPRRPPSWRGSGGAGESRPAFGVMEVRRQSMNGRDNSRDLLDHKSRQVDPPSA
jgi:hypothetical protein